MRPGTHPTRTDMETLRALWTYREQEGHMPSIRELMPMLAVQSTSVVATRLERLERLGWISRKPHLSRAITLKVRPS